jgi:hypothetical protein
MKLATWSARQATACSSRPRDSQAIVPAPWEELSAQHIKSEDTVESLQAEVARQRGLNEKLENDLMSLNKEGLERSGGSGIGLAGLDIGGKGVVSVSIVTQAGADDEGGQDSEPPVPTSSSSAFRCRNRSL